LDPVSMLLLLDVALYWWSFHPEVWTLALLLWIDKFVIQWEMDRSDNGSMSF
jgi:hypothetical protein